MKTIQHFEFKLRNLFTSVTLQRVAMVMVRASMEVSTVSQAYTLVSPACW